MKSPHFNYSKNESVLLGMAFEGAEGTVRERFIKCLPKYQEALSGA